MTTLGAETASSSGAAPTNGDNDLDADARDLAQAGLQAGVLSDPRARAAVLRAVAAQLAEGVSPSTARRLVASLTALTDQETPQLLLTFVSRAWEDLTLLDDLMKCGAEDDFVLWIREVLSLHGRGVRIARLVDGQDPGGWLDVQREVYFDEVEMRWMVRLSITKIDGAVVEFTDEVINMVALAQLVLEACLLVPQEARALDPLATRVKQVFEVAKELVAAPTSAKPPEDTPHGDMATEDAVSSMQA